MADGDSIGRYLRRYMAVLPSYEALFQKRPSLEDFLQIIRRYPKVEWLSVLNRMQTCLAQSGQEPTEIQRRLFQQVLSHDLQERLYSWLRTAPRRPDNVVLFYERQVATLQALVILHAPDLSDHSIYVESNQPDVGIALLMVCDLMHPREDISRAIIPDILLQHLARSLFPATFVFLGRLFTFYRLAETEPSGNCRALFTLFEKQTGVNAREFILGGALLLIEEAAKGIEEIARGTVCTTPITATYESQRPALAAYLKLNSNTLPAIAAAIEAYDLGLAISDMSLIGLYRYPILRLLEPDVFIIMHLGALARSLFEGVRHHLLDRAPQGAKRKEAIKHICGLYGAVFEDYVATLLEKAFRGRVARIPCAKGESRADFVIRFPQQLVIIEAKSSRPPANKVFRNLPLRERQADAYFVQLKEAAKQLASTIREFRVLKRDIPLLRNVAWETTALIPVILTETEPFLFPGCFDSFYQAVRAPLHTLMERDGRVRPLRLMSLRELEIIPNADYSDDWGTLLSRWATDPERTDMCFKNFLIDLQYKVEDPFLKDGFRCLQQLLIKDFCPNASDPDNDLEPPG